MISIPRTFRFFRNELTIPDSVFKDSILILQGSLIQAIGYTVFLIPNKIIPGGLYGVGTVLLHLWSIPVGTAVFLMNVPLLLWGIKALGARFGMRTVASIILTSAFTDIIYFLFESPNLTDDLMVQAIIGGILVGYGVSSVFKTGATTGGVEIVGQIFNRKLKLSIGRTILFINVGIIGTGVLFLGDLSMVIYSVVSVFAISKMMDASLEGISYYKLLIIASEKHELIYDQVHSTIKKEIHYVYDSSNYKKKLMLTTLSRRETTFLKEYVKSIDEKARVVIVNAQEVMNTRI